jgi:hypothetical protein
LDTLVAEIIVPFIQPSQEESMCLVYGVRVTIDRIILAKPYKNMKVLATNFWNSLYGTRMLVERHFRNLKQFFGLVTSMPRSITGYFANYFYSIVAYQTSQMRLLVMS